MAGDCIKKCISFVLNETYAHVSRRCVFIIAITTYTVVYNPKYTKRALCKPGKYLQTPTADVAVQFPIPYLQVIFISLTAVKKKKK